MKAYITATAAISPQPTFQEEGLLSEIVVPENSYFSALEPSYKELIDPKLSRRMSRIIKMSVASASQCLQKAGVEQPGAIVVGTGLGCLQDTEKFLVELLENTEGLLSPTSFIQSTHNTIAGQIALLLNCPTHNFTFVQRGHSFERALEDGLLQLQEGTEGVLVGGVDEVIPSLLEILNKLNCAGKPPGKEPTIPTSAQKAFWGEGASFFFLTAKPTQESLACVEGMHTFYQGGEKDKVKEQLQRFLEDCGKDLSEVDAVMMGFNGNEQEDTVYHTIKEHFFSRKLVLSFKNLCGEYFTASAFGLCLAARVLQKQEVPEAMVVEGAVPKALKNILLYNQVQGKYHTFILLSGCQPLS